MKRISMHSHTDKSDGQLTPQEHAQFFVDNNYLMFAPADHHFVHTKWLKQFGYGKNTLKQVFYPIKRTDISPQVELNGDTQNINFVIACEFTVRDPNVENLKGNFAKYHMIVVAPMLDKENEFMQLLRIKRENDIDYDLAYVEYVFRLKGIEYPALFVNEFREKYGVSSFNLETAKQFFEIYFKAFPEMKSKFYSRKSEFEKTLRNIDTVKRINVPVKVLVDAVHAAGGMVFVAHPDRNLYRVEHPVKAIRSLIEAGVDGFNLKECKNPLFKGKLIADMDLTIQEQQIFLKGGLAHIFKYICDSIPHKNPLIFDAGGNDPHTQEEYLALEHDLFTTTKCRSILKELTHLHLARISGKTTHRDYGTIDLTPVRQFIQDNTPVVEIVNETTGQHTIQYNRHTNYGKFADREITRDKKDTLVKDVRKAISLGVDCSNGLTIKGVYLSKDWVNKILFRNITSTDYLDIVAGAPAKAPGQPTDEAKRFMVSREAPRFHNNNKGGM